MYSFQKRHLLKGLYFPHCVVLTPLLKIIWLCMCEFISGPFCSIRLYASTILFCSFLVCFQVWKSEALRFVLLSQDCFSCLGFHMNSRIFFFYFWKKKKSHSDFNRGYTESLNSFGLCGHCNNIKASNPWTHAILAFICVFYNFFQ